MLSDEVLQELASASENDLGRALLEAARVVNAILFDQLVGLGHKAVRSAHTAVFSNLDPTGTRMVTLAQRAGVSRQAMSQLVRDLQIAGYVDVQPDPDDGRATRVVLTDRGIAFCLDAARVIRELEQHWQQLLGPGRLKELRATLRALSQA
ncbi:MarR family transcriptional regulator [Streptomyces sp. NPDC008092]|uniref:MarR family winged helix-turn-helix transcriptional regulator n=1 Tax=Streptomyces sp. NPDC008092 TaxID=3364808 RepID=UPI0036E9E170